MDCVWSCHRSIATAMHAWRDVWIVLPEYCHSHAWRNVWIVLPEYCHCHACMKGRLNCVAGVLPQPCMHGGTSEQCCRSIATAMHAWRDVWTVLPEYCHSPNGTRRVQACVSVNVCCWRGARTCRAWVWRWRQLFRSSLPSSRSSHTRRPATASLRHRSGSAAPANKLY